MNKNELGHKTSNKLSEFISNSTVIPLEHLELHYNNFNGEDMIEFANNLNKSKLKILDLSWNNLGSNKEFIRKLSENIIQNS